MVLHRMDESGASAVDASAAADAALPGQAIYTRPVLAIYDLWVHGISNPLIWRCPTRHLRRLYARHLSANHMDVGIGTGYFLSRCPFPSPSPRLLLVDANPTCLAVAEGRLRRHRPRLHRGNIIESLGNLGGAIDSIGLMYVLHCLPGDLGGKAECSTLSTPASPPAASSSGRRSSAEAPSRAPRPGG